jgi:hypothetical protein
MGRIDSSGNSPYRIYYFFNAISLGRFMNSDIIDQRPILDASFTNKAGMFCNYYVKETKDHKTVDVRIDSNPYHLYNFLNLDIHNLINFIIGKL